jgi:hypothetical protein
MMVGREGDEEIVERGEIVRLKGRAVGRLKRGV